MGRRKGLIEEFWENAGIPPVRHRAMEELFDELSMFTDPKTYGADGILRSIMKLFTDMLK